MEADLLKFLNKEEIGEIAEESGEASGVIIQNSLLSNMLQEYEAEIDLDISFLKDDTFSLYSDDLIYCPSNLNSALEELKELVEEINEDLATEIDNNKDEITLAFRNVYWVLISFEMPDDPSELLSDMDLELYSDYRKIFLDDMDEKECSEYEKMTKEELTNNKKFTEYMMNQLEEDPYNFKMEEEFKFDNNFEEYKNTLKYR